MEQFNGGGSDQALGERTTGEWIEILGGSVPAAPVYDVAEALASPFIEERQCVAEFGTEENDSLRMLAGPIRLEDAAAPTNPAPATGADTDDILNDLGSGAATNR